MRVFSVATISYLYQAEVLFSSLRKVHPEFRLTLIVADCSPTMLQSIQAKVGGDFELICCADLQIENIEIMRNYYGALEFCSALKVLGMKYFLNVEEECLFLDPDILIFSRLDHVFSDLSCEVIMCRHTHSPYPIDGQPPNDLDLCLSGHINGGVFFVRRGPQGTPALDWLVSKTAYQWFVAPKYGMYADQQWLSALPFFFFERIKLILDKGINVAYWNLHERSLRKVNEDTISVCGEERLRLFHFSGFSAFSKNHVSIHSSRRFDVQTERVIEGLIKSYSTELYKAQLKYKGLSGDLYFCNYSLKLKLKIAQKFWGKDANPMINLSFSESLKKYCKKLFKY